MAEKVIYNIDRYVPQKSTTSNPTNKNNTQISIGDAMLQYRVKKGDTLYAIAKYNNIPLAKLLEANPSVDSQKLKIDSTLNIPNDNASLNPFTKATVSQSITNDVSFEKMLRDTLKFEGGYVNNPKDPGGRTNKGITQTTYNNYLK